MNTYSNIPSINYAMIVMKGFWNLLPKMTPEGAKVAVNRLAVELRGAARMATIKGDQAGAALLVALAEILVLARKTNSVKSLVSLKSALLMLGDESTPNDSSIPF